jgi:hypothetical protein
MAGGRNVRLNTDTGFLKLVAIITMAIDHTGAAILPQYPILRVIGRIAFPIFAYSMAVGCVYTRDMRRYMLRMLLLALVSQPLYALGLNHTTSTMNAMRFDVDPLMNAVRWYLMSWNRPSILVSLMAGMLLIWCFKDKRYALAAVFAAVILYFQAYLDYGWRGIALMLLFYAFLEYPGASFAWVLGFMLWWGISGGGGYRAGSLSFSTQTFAVLALPLIYLPTRTNLKLPKWFFYLFYPAHLAALYAAQQLLARQPL